MQYLIYSIFILQNEIDRYITWPGQALAYKTGELKIQELRKNAENKLGPSLFNIKDFHDIVLESYGPLDVVEDEVNFWVENVLGSTRKK